MTGKSPQRIDQHLRRMAEDAVLDVMQGRQVTGLDDVRQKAAELLQDRYGEPSRVLGTHLDNAVAAIDYLSRTWAANQRVSQR